MTHPVARITYTVLVETLNHAQSINTADTTNYPMPLITVSSTVGICGSLLCRWCCRI